VHLTILKLQSVTQLDTGEEYYDGTSYQQPVFGRV